jgi:hypothetical protein
MAALRPEQAVVYLRALSCDLEGVAVRSADAEHLAGDPTLPGAAVVERDGHREIALDLGPLALVPLARHDARAALRALRPDGPA